MNIRLILSGLAALTALCAISATARAQIFVENFGNGLPGTGSIAEYTTSGVLVNPKLISGLTFPGEFVISGDKLFLANGDAGTISEYTTSGMLMNPSLISGLFGPFAIAVSGGFLYVSTSAVIGEADMIGKYTTSGATVNAALIDQLGPVGDIKVSGNNLFYSDGTDNVIGKYTTSGAPVSANFSGLSFNGEIAISGDKLFVANSGADPGTGTISEYTTSGTLVNPSLVSGLNVPLNLALSGGDLFVTSSSPTGDSSLIGEYTTSGATVNPSLISGLSNGYVVVLPESVPDESSTWTLLLLGLTATFGLKIVLGSREPGARSTEHFAGSK